MEKQPIYSRVMTEYALFLVDKILEAPPHSFQPLIENFLGCWQPERVQNKLPYFAYVIHNFPQERRDQLGFDDAEALKIFFRHYSAQFFKKIQQTRSEMGAPAGSPAFVHAEQQYLSQNIPAGSLDSLSQTVYSSMFSAAQQPSLPEKRKLLEQTRTTLVSLLKSMECK